MSLNRLNNIKNPYQGTNKKVLCVCSAGLLRSPTAAWVLSNEPFNFNTRAAGLNIEYALIPVDNVLLEWADVVVCMNEEQKEIIEELLDVQVINFNIPDNYGYRDPQLVEIITRRALECFK